MMRSVAILAATASLLLMTPAVAKTLRIVAIGASNTQGFYAGREAAYPAQLQKLLKQNGIDAEMIKVLLIILFIDASSLYCTVV